MPRPVIRRRSLLPAFASFAALAFVLVSVTSPMSQNQAAAAEIVAELDLGPTQVLTVAGDYSTEVVRDGFTATPKPKPVAPPPPAAGAGRSAPAAGTPDPGSAKAIAYDMVLARGWGEDQYSCLVALWNRESGWNAFAMNKSSGAYGIPQALPGTKMASAGADWATNPATQITWGLGYISGRYSTPCGAWQASETKGWY
ncbi:MAG: hypothetical protein RI885_2554 [Actinomycetota bacterium]